MESKKQVTLEVAIPCRLIGKENEAIADWLDGMKSQYLRETDGFLMKWKDMKIQNDKGTILGDQPYVFWNVSFEGQFFKPVEGKILKGQVEKINPDYLIVKVMKSFSVTVTIPEEFKTHPVITAVMLETEIYFRIKNRYTGLLDEECIQLSEKITDEQSEDVYHYARDFEY